MAEKQNLGQSNLERAAIGAAVRGASGLVVLLTFQRVANVILNQLLIRKVDPATFGMASNYFDLILQTALFLSREGFRISLGRLVFTRDPPIPLARLQRFINLSWLPTLLNLILSTSLYHFISADYRSTAGLFCTAALIESFAEPLYLVAQSYLINSIRVFSEGTAVLIKTFATYYFLVYYQMGAAAFGWSQILYSFTILLMYWGYFIYQIHVKHTFPFRSVFDLLPRPLVGSSSLLSLQRWTDLGNFELAVAMIGQSLVKHLLTQGDRIVLSFFSSFYDQGVYALSQNYASLVVRLVLQPMEESGRLLFARLTSDGDNGSGGSTVALRKLLVTFLKLAFYCGMVFSCFGFNYTRVLLTILLPGKKWEEGQGDAAWVLSCYCFYILFLALNGITEAFVYAVTTKEKVARLTLMSGISFLVFALSTPILMKALGTAGLVLANCLAMASRILFSLDAISRYFQAHKGNPFLVSEFLPEPTVFVLFGLSMLIGLWTDSITNIKSLSSVGVHILVGGFCFLVIALAAFSHEKPLLATLKELNTLRRA